MQGHNVQWTGSVVASDSLLGDEDKAKAQLFVLTALIPEGIASQLPREIEVIGFQHWSISQQTYYQNCDEVCHNTGTNRQRY